MAGSTTPAISVFVISLLSASTRRKKISRALDGLEIDFEWFDAIDTSRGLSAQHENMIDRGRHPLSDAEYGCALSHAAIYRHIVEHSIAHAIVLEDDAIPLPELKRFIDTRSYRAYPLIQLYHNKAYVRRGEVVALFDSVSARTLTMSCNSTVGYSLNLQAATELCKATNPVSNVADWPIDLSTINACLTQPLLVQHPPDRDDSVIAIARRGNHRSLSRYLTKRYYQKKWRKLMSERVRSAQL